MIGPSFDPVTIAAEVLKSFSINEASVNASHACSKPGGQGRCFNFQLFKHAPASAAVGMKTSFPNRYSVRPHVIMPATLHWSAVVQDGVSRTTAATALGPEYSVAARFNIHLGRNSRWGVHPCLCGRQTAGGLHCLVLI